MPSDFVGIDPILSLALALHNTRGGYALLLGSGISRAAGIPTGWEVVEDLIRHIASLEGEETAATTDLKAWYVRRFSEEPSYSRLLEQLASTAAERRELLRSYFEPTAEERTDGIKAPTKAHRAVARLARDGIIRVILTTNFDQLLETSLRDEGVTPAVLSTPDLISGMMPLHLEPATIVKLHGDYLDTRIKNTPEELSTYDTTTDRLLDRVFDEYGLIVCGWSATWDDALRAAILRAPNRRFSTFWVSRGEPTLEAQQIIEARKALVISIESADNFLDVLAEKVAAVEALKQPQPISTAAAVAALKRYLPSSEQRIRLYDLMMAEVESAAELVRTIISTETQPTTQKVLDAMTQIEGASERLTTLVATGAYWGENAHSSIWQRTLERLATVHSGPSSYEAWNNLWRYPAQIVFYAAGLAMLAQHKKGGETLLDLLLVPELRFADRRTPESPVVALNVSEAIDIRLARALPGYERRYTPISDRLCDVLKPILMPFFSTEDAYEAAFDRFEYLVALAYADYRVYKAKIGFWVPGGRFVWRREWASAAGQPNIADQIAAEIARDGVQWPMLQRGLFEGSLERLTEMHALMREHSQRYRDSF